MLEKLSTEDVDFGNDGTASSSKSQLQCCLFCYRNCNDATSKNNSCATKNAINTFSPTTSVLNPSQPLMQKFFMLFQRCMMDNQRSGNLHGSFLPVPFENHFERLGTCQDCSILLQDFCTLYDQIKCLELKLSWRLKGLHDIMKSADKVPSRLKIFRNLIVTNEQEEKEPGKETLIEIKKFRNGLMNKCSAKLRSTYPKIQLKRCNSSEADCPGDDTNKRIKIEKVKPEQGSTIISENESKSQATPKLESITVKPLNIEDEGSSIIDVSSVFPVSVKVPQSEEAEESCESNCDGNIEREESSDKLGCNKGDDIRLPSPTERQTDDDLPASCTSSTIHSERNQNQEDSDRNKCDQNQIAITNVPSKMTENLKKTVNIVNTNPIVDASSVFPVLVKVPPCEDAEESCGSSCDGNIDTEEAPDKLGRNEGDAFRFSSPSEKQTNDDAPCISSTIHLERNQNQEDGERKKYDKNLIVTTNIASKITEQLKETCQTVPVNKNQRRYSKRLGRVKAVDAQRPNNTAFTKADVDQMEIYSPLASEGESSDDDDDYIPEPDDDAGSMSEVDAHQLDDDDNHISIKETRNILRLNKVEEKKSAEVESVKDPTKSFTNMNSKGKTGLLSLKQLAMNSVLDLPLKLRCKINSCRHTSFISSNDLSNHSKWHANFECNFCELTFDYAPSLVKHEINEHTRKGKERNCARCCFSVKGDEFSVLTHYLKSHLGLPVVRHTCPICGTIFRRKASLRKVFLSHFNREHNITGVALTIMNKCDENQAVQTTNMNECAVNVFPNKRHISTFKEPKILSRGKDGKFRTSKGKQEQLSLKQLALDKVLELSAKLCCKIQPCVSKTKTFLSSRDFANHSKLHANFKCNFCETILDYAPDLVAHEIKENFGKAKDGKNLETCPRCDYRFDVESSKYLAVRHYFEVHLNLKKDINTCPICCEPITIKGSLRKSFLEHYQSHHDLTEMPTGKKCKESYCGAYFRTYHQLYKHSREIHHVSFNGIFICEDCGMQHENRLDLEHHQLNHVLPTEFKIHCSFSNCEKMFEREVDMQYHKRLMHESEVGSFSQSSKSILSTTPEGPLCYLLKGQQPKIHKCERPECERKFYSASDLEIHSRLHGDFKCRFCNTTFTFAPELPVHEIECGERGEGEKLENSLCTRCFWKVSDEKKFISHFVEKHLDLEMDRHLCFICGDSFGARTLKNFQEHLRQQHDLRKVCPDGKTYECKMEGCSAYFLRPGQLARHKKSHVIAGKFKVRLECEDGKKYECSDCCKRFKSLFYLREHRERKHLHRRLKPFTCISSVCELRFDTEAERDDHIADTGVMKCPTCDKWYHGGFGLNGFKKHVVKCQQNKEAGNCKKKPTAAATLQRKWQCEECGKSFKAKENLSRHRLAHSGPASWEYMCSICSKKCMTEHHLDTHMISHSNEKDFVCEICGVKYKHRHNLRLHVNSKHGDIAYDKPRNFDKTNLTSRKGIKLKTIEETGTKKRKRNGPKQTKKKKYDSSSDSSFSD